MKVLELFAGTRSIGKAFEARGHEVYSVEWDKRFEDINLYEDILRVQADDIIRLFGKPDVVWASPDCTTFSIAAISHHRRKSENGGTMSDLIDREQAIAEMHLAFGAKPAVHAQAVIILESLPSAEKTGRWVMLLPMKHRFYCSVCGQLGEKYWNYCTMCGAKNKED